MRVQEKVKVNQVVNSETEAPGPQTEDTKSTEVTNVTEDIIETNWGIKAGLRPLVR